MKYNKNYKIILFNIITYYVLRTTSTLRMYYEYPTTRTYLTKSITRFVHVRLVLHTGMTFVILNKCHARTRM